MVLDSAMPLAQLQLACHLSVVDTPAKEKTEKEAKAQAKGALEALDIEAALTEYTGSPEKRAALKRALVAQIDLAIVPDEELEETDIVQKSRLVYVLSLMRLLAYLRSPDGNAAEKAKIALGYVRHAEANSLAWLQFGRSAADNSLMKEVQALRNRMAEVSAVKAKLLVEAHTQESAGAAEEETESRPH